MREFIKPAVLLLFCLVLVNLVSAATITANVTETNINSTVLLTGEGFISSTNYSLIPLLEEKSAWWDGFSEQWINDNITITVLTNSSGGFQYSWYVPNDWRISGGKVRFKTGASIGSALLWSSQGLNWTGATQPTNNGVVGFGDELYISTQVTPANVGGIKKLNMSTGASICQYNHPTNNGHINDVSTNAAGSIVYGVTSTATTNLLRMNASTCAAIGTTSTAAGAALSVNKAADNSFIIITYASGYAPRKYNISVDAPTQIAAFAATAVASDARDSCISPDGLIVYVGYVNGNITALNTTGGIIWNYDPAETELGNAGYAFPVNGLACDADRVYVARGPIAFPTGISNQAFVEALNATTGLRVWMNSKTDTIYDGMDLGNIRCDTAFCYAVKQTTPANYLGLVGSAIVQINKTTGNVTWWNWRSWLPTTYLGSYGAGGTHSSAQALWIDTNTTGYLYPIYTNGWTQKIAKTDVNSSVVETNLWIRGSTNFWNYIADVPKNIFLSNETPYYTFQHWNQQGLPLRADDQKLVGTFFRYSMLNTFNSYSAYEYTATSVLGNSLYINPVVQVAPLWRNAIKFYNNTPPTTATLCNATYYGYANLSGWYYEDANCHYTEMVANATGFNIGTTINGTFMSGFTYALIKTKFWENYPITKYYGADNWAWAAMYPSAGNTTQVLGFATKFGADQEDVYSDIYGRGVLFANYGTTRLYRPQFRADLNRKSDSYIFFMPKAQDGLNVPVEETLWHRVELETTKVANPVIINLSTSEIGDFTIGTVPANYSRRINFTAQEPNLLNRSNEPVEIIFTAEGIRSDCADVIITNESDSQIDLWQVDNSTTCIAGGNVSVWIMMNWTRNETKNLRIYYNGSLATPSPTGTTDLTVSSLTGTCGINQEANVLSSNWYNWTKPMAASAANEITKFMFNDSTNLWASGTHTNAAVCYKNSNTLLTGVGSGTDTCTASAVVLGSRCVMTGSTGKIFVKINGSAVMGAVTNANRDGARTVLVEYQFFANTGRVRIRTQLNQSMPIMNTTVSKNWPPYYYISINNFIPPQGANSWLYYGGLYDQMKKKIVTYNADYTVANLSAGPLPLVFTINYAGINYSQANGSILRPANPSGGTYWGTGCTAHKEWQYYAYAGGSSSGTATAPLYMNEFISCSKDVASMLPAMGAPGYVNVIPEMDWDGTSTNRFADPTLIGKFYLKPNLYRPFNREAKYLPPYATSNPYSTAKLSSYIIPICPEKEYGYKGYDDFLADLDNLIANTSNRVKTTTLNIPCAAQIITRTDSKGSDGRQIIFARNLSVIVGEIASAGRTYPFNTFVPGTYAYQLNGDLDLTFTQKAATTTGYYGKWYFTYTPNNYIIDSFYTSGAPQNVPTPALSSAAGVAGTYAQRYAFAPDTYYVKSVWDESALWDKASQNFTYYLNPCWLGQINNKYGATQSGSPDSATPGTPGWSHYSWGGASTYAHATLCPFTTYNMEHQDVFRPSFSSKYPTNADTVVINELLIAGRMNFNGSGTPPGGDDTYALAVHNSLLDYKHSDDYTSILENINDLEEGVKHPNKQPWYCQISRKTNQSFCMMSSTTSTLIYNGNPGALSAANGWSPYWSSVREMATYRNQFTLKYFDTSAWLFPTSHVLEVSMYPTLSNDEVFLANMLYVSNDADDYSTFFQKQSGKAQDGLWQTQFLLKDWKNSIFFTFDSDSRQYAPGQVMNVSGLFVRSGNVFANKSINIQVFKNNGLYISTYATSTDASGVFNWSYTLPTTLTAGLYYLQVNYNNSEFLDSVPFVVTTYNVVTETDKGSYVQGEQVTIGHTITDYVSGDAVDPVVLKEEISDAYGTVIKCSRYPATVAGCTNLLTKSGTGLYGSSLILDETLPSGSATVKVTTTDANNVDSYYYAGFGVGRTAGTITISLQNQLTASTFTSNVSATNTGYELASKTAEVTVPTPCGYIVGVTNSTAGNVSYSVQDLSSACKLSWTVSLAGKQSTWYFVQATISSPSVSVNYTAIAEYVWSNPTRNLTYSESSSSINYTELANYVWNHTTRSLTYYNQSYGESLQACLKDASCVGWWVNTTLSNLESKSDLLNATASDIIANTHDILDYLDCNATNQVCTRLQSIINNASEIKTLVQQINLSTNSLNSTAQNTYSVVQSLNMTQVPLLQSSVNSIFQDTQWLVSNVSTQLNTSEMLLELYELQQNVTYLRNNMFTQGNATGALLVEYVGSSYTEPGNRAELLVLTKNMVGSPRQVTAATCVIERGGVYYTNAVIVNQSSGIFVSWDVPANQAMGGYNFNCSITSNTSTITLQVPFFVSASPYFSITSLSAGSPRYPNENIIIEATFETKNGSVSPDNITMIIYKPNYLTTWHSSLKSGFSVQSNVWSWNQTIEDSPTTGMYYVLMEATYNGYVTSRTTQFRIATGGPYKVYLSCPATSSVGEELFCTVMLQDEGEAATESVTEIWVDLDSDGEVDPLEPQRSFAKRTVPQENVTLGTSLNIPASQATGVFVVRARTEYLNSNQPDSTSSDSVLFVEQSDTEYGSGPLSPTAPVGISTMCNYNGICEEGIGENSVYCGLDSEVIIDGETRRGDCKKMNLAQDIFCYDATQPCNPLSYLRIVGYGIVLVVGVYLLSILVRRDAVVVADDDDDDEK